MKVINDYGVEINFESAVNLMDDSIREAVHDRIAPYTEQEFFNVYCAMHRDIFNEEFEANKKNPVW